MRLSHILTVAATVLLLPAAGFAEAPQNAPAPDSAAPAETAPSAAGDDLAWDQFDDPDFEPAAAEPAAAAQAEELEASVVAEADDMWASAPDEGATPSVTASGVLLGPVGVDDQGRSGRLHTVSRGDTLWDISAAYLGTPWVWPSVWTDNGDIANPHLILPGDKIWITANEMRVVTDAEAESFLTPVVEENNVAVDFEPVPVEDSVPPLAALDGAEDEPSTLDAFPVAIPGQEPTGLSGSRQITVASRERMGFITAETLAGASSIVESTSERTYLTAGDPVFLGMGEGDVEVGDRFSIFRVVEPVHDVETNRVLGHHVESLGWVEVKELTGDTSIGEIRQSYEEIVRGAQVVPREKLSRRVTIRTTPDAIEGQIVFLPGSRTVMADGGYVYLNRGEFHGVEVGSELEVFDPGAVMNERERRVDVRTPDTAVATLIVVSVEADSSVAYVLNAKRELVIGDRVRPIVEQLAGR